MKFRTLALLLVLSSCSSQPAAPSANPLTKPASTVAAFSHLGNDFTVDVISRTLIRPKEQSLDVSAWGVDAALVQRTRAEAEGYGQRYKPLELDPKAVDRAIHTRESRWKKFLGKHNQALLDLLLKKAGEQGVDTLVWLSPMESRDTFPLHKGDMGIYCYDRKILKSRAYAYFFLDLSVWDVKAKKKLFHKQVDPAATQEMTFAECQEVANLKEPVTALKEPVAHSIDLLVKKVMREAAEELGWAAGAKESPGAL